MMLLAQGKNQISYIFLSDTTLRTMKMTRTMKTRLERMLLTTNLVPMTSTLTCCPMGLQGWICMAPT